MDWQGTLQPMTAEESLQSKEDKKQQDYEVAKLLPRHASLVNNNWEFKNSRSLQMLEGLIQQGNLLGLFLAGHNEPIAWISIYRCA